MSTLYNLYNWGAEVVKIWLALPVYHMSSINIHVVTFYPRHIYLMQNIPHRRVVWPELYNIVYGRMYKITYLLDLVQTQERSRATAVCVAHPYTQTHWRHIHMKCVQWVHTTPAVKLHVLVSVCVYSHNYTEWMNVLFRSPHTNKCTSIQVSIKGNRGDPLENYYYF